METNLTTLIAITSAMGMYVGWLISSHELVRRDKKEEYDDNELDTCTGACHLCLADCPHFSEPTYALNNGL